MRYKEKINMLLQSIERREIRLHDMFEKGIAKAEDVRAVLERNSKDLEKIKYYLSLEA